jgi:hypothetical protein
MNAYISHGYDHVKRRTNGNSLKNIFDDFESIILEINHCNTHWMFINIEVAAYTIHYYDSMDRKGQGGREYLDRIKTWLQEEAIFKEKQQFINATWIIQRHNNSPQQSNNCDCGIHALLNIELVLDHIPVETRFYNTSDIAFHRRRICAAILRSRSIDNYPILINEL